jgi:hypothetical protein
MRISLCQQETAPVVLQLQAYLYEFVFRHIRRSNHEVAFQTLLGLGSG